MIYPHVIHDLPHVGWLWSLLLLVSPHFPAAVPVLPIVSVEVGQPRKLPGGFLLCGEGEDNIILGRPKV